MAGDSCVVVETEPEHVKLLNTVLGETVTMRRRGGARFSRTDAICVAAGEAKELLAVIKTMFMTHLRLFR